MKIRKSLGVLPDTDKMDFTSENTDLIMRITEKRQRGESGFTLVELAISMMIIGLLVGGILKSGELIENARVTATLARINDYKAAMNTFRAKYSAFPGDMIDPGDRLPGCDTAPCTTAGNGDRYIAPQTWGVDANNNISTLLSYSEGTNFWLHMQKAGMINGVAPNGATGGPPYGGRQVPASPMKGAVLVAGYAPSSSVSSPYTMRRGNILVLMGNGAAPVVKASLAYLLDQKVDDGKPYTGEVISATNCGRTAIAGADYKQTSDSTSLCEVVFYVSN